MKKIFAILIVLVLTVSLCGCDSSDYKSAMELYNAGDYVAARSMFVNLGDYKDSSVMATKCDYEQALVHLEDEEYTKARELFASLGDYKDCPDMVAKCDYEQALLYMEDEEYAKAHELFVSLGDYKDSSDMASLCNYEQAMLYMEDKEHAEARELFVALGDYKDSTVQATVAARYMLADYLDENDVTKKDGNYVTIMIMQSGDDICMEYRLKMSALTLYFNYTIAISIDSQKGNVIIEGTENSGSHAAEYDAEAKSHFDLSTYRKNTTLTWDEFDVTGTTAQGKKYTQDDTLLGKALSTSVPTLVEELASVLRESGLGLTMADIGFTSY